MTEHTPGPWTQEPFKDGKINILTEWGDRPTADMDRAPYVIAKVIPLLDQTEANAHLMDSAPDMLAALEPFAALADWFQTSEAMADNTTVAGVIEGNPRVTVGDCRRAAEAVAKAKGRAP